MYSMFGTDCLGGIAYFGLIKDIKDVQIQSDKYLSYFSNDNYYGKCYAMWEIEDYSLLLLYEDYQEKLDNPYPVNSNVMSLQFGAWISDYNLLQVLMLNEDERDMHGAEWFVGSEPFDEGNSTHQLLFTQFKPFINEICPLLESYDEEENS